jgi:hypothetical protein
VEGDILVMDDKGLNLRKVKFALVKSCVTLGASVLTFSALKAEAEYFSKMSVPIYKTTQCHNPEDQNLNNHHHENLENVLIYFLCSCVIG